MSQERCPLDEPRLRHPELSVTTPCDDPLRRTTSTIRDLTPVRRPCERRGPQLWRLLLNLGGSDLRFCLRPFCPEAPSSAILGPCLSGGGATSGRRWIWHTDRSVFACVRGRWLHSIYVHNLYLSGMRAAESPHASLRRTTTQLSRLTCAGTWSKSTNLGRSRPASGETRPPAVDSAQRNSP